MSEVLRTVLFLIAVGIPMLVWMMPLLVCHFNGGCR
jgi:hypothetical protein